MQASPQRVNATAHAPHAVTFSLLARIEATAVVTNHESQPSPVAGQCHVKRRAARVLGGVGHALLQDEKHLTPHVGTYVVLESGERLGVRRARLSPGTDGIEPGALAVQGDRLLYGGAQGALELVEVHPAGRRPMEAAAWLRGRAGRVPGPATE